MEIANLSLVSLSDRLVPAVADLHGRCLGGLLTQLGRPVTRLYYAGCVANSLALGFVALEGEDLCGFVLGSAHPVALRRDLVRQRPWVLTAALALGILRRPVVLGGLFQVWRNSTPGRYDSLAPELTYLAVDPARRGAGIGRCLVDTFTRNLRAAGAEYFELSVEETNSAAIACYERLGFRRLGRYQEFGQGYLRLRRHPDGPEGAAGG